MTHSFPLRTEPGNQVGASVPERVLLHELRQEIEDLFADA